MTLNVRTDRRLIRALHRSSRFVLGEITAPLTTRQNSNDGRLPVNLAFVLDRSGSMGGDKIRLAKQAVNEALDRLHPDDRFSVVVYDDHIDVVMPTSAATTEARREALERLARIEARGSTDLGGGWLRGCEQVALALSEEGVNRCLLLTDGLANVGMKDPDELARHADELRARGVSTSTFGVGADFDERLLQSMASAGGGNFYYIADAAAIRDHITSEVGESLDIVARGVVLEVTAPRGVRVEALSPYPTRQHGGWTEIEIGNLTSDQQLQVVLRLTFPFGQEGEGQVALLSLADRDAVLQADGKVRWDYADDAGNDNQDRNREVDRAVAQIFAARARQQAVQLNRAGDYEGARLAMAATAKRIKGYAGNDVELKKFALDLSTEGQEMAAPMPEPSRKVMFASSSYVLRSRSLSGEAVKSPRSPKA
ncbi:MAG: vWA domain-containing protein [Candidatus Limnocylindrales bacterium]